MNECRRIYGQCGDLILVGTAETALKNADALVTVTEWQQFRAPVFDQIISALTHPSMKYTNALTIDVEDYFQVSAFEHSIRRSDWD